MGNKRVKAKGRGKEPSFLLLPHYILSSDEWGALEPGEAKLLLDLAKEYRGKNNGNFSAPWSAMRRRGWKSPGTLQADKAGLLAKGWIVCTRHGGSHRCSLYAVTWWPLDECDGKSEIGGEHAPRHSWKNTSGSRNPYRSDTHGDCKGPGAAE